VRRRAAEAHIASYDLWVHHFITPEGERLFDKGKRLLSHWNLRDEIKAQYSEGGAELERVAKFGRTTPDVWMVNATGSPVSAAPLLRATAAAVAEEATASASK
jgi:hypothetical protein